MIATQTRDALELRPVSCGVTWRGRSMHLSPVRWRLIVSLARAQGQVVDGQDLARRLFGAGGAKAQAHLRVVISQTRERVPGLIETETGRGYRLATSHIVGDLSWPEVDALLVEP
jgi:two-component system KDP operon response regulator KdpE